MVYSSVRSDFARSLHRGWGLAFTQGFRNMKLKTKDDSDLIRL
jgi:hypothetical protein